MVSLLLNVTAGAEILDICSADVSVPETESLVELQPHRDIVEKGIQALQEAL